MSFFFFIKRTFKNAQLMIIHITELIKLQFFYYNYNHSACQHGCQLVKKYVNVNDIHIKFSTFSTLMIVSPLAQLYEIMCICQIKELARNVWTSHHKSVKYTENLLRQTHFSLQHKKKQVEKIWIKCWNRKAVI